VDERIGLYPVFGISYWDDDSLDLSTFPLEVVPGVTLESTKPYLDDDAFDWMKETMGSKAVEALQSVDYALVCRYQAKPTESEAEANQAAEAIVRNLSACLRLIRPLGQRASFIRGDLGADGKMRVYSFEAPTQIEGLDVYRGKTLSDADISRFKAVAPKFLSALAGSYSKFRMSAYLHEIGFFSEIEWSARFALWCSAIEALYTSINRDHRGSWVARERVKWFLGNETAVFKPGDGLRFESLEEDSVITVGSIIGDLYELRNFVVHGERSPAKFWDGKRTVFGRSISLAEAIVYTASFVVRASLLKILEEDLLENFADGAGTERYFSKNKLTLPDLKLQKRSQNS
jgi:hypothetical protein